MTIAAMQELLKGQAYKAENVTGLIAELTPSKVNNTHS